MTLTCFQPQEALHSQASSQLIVARGLKMKQMETYLQQIAQGIAQLPDVQTAIRQLERGVREREVHRRQWVLLAEVDLSETCGPSKPLRRFEELAHLTWSEIPYPEDLAALSRTGSQTVTETETEIGRQERDGEALPFGHFVLSG